MGTHRAEPPAQIHTDESRPARDEHGLSVHLLVAQAALGHNAEI